MNPVNGTPTQRSAQGCAATFCWVVQSFATIASPATHPPPRYTSVKFQIGAVYDVSPRWSLEGGFFETIAGGEAGRELGPTAALWYHF